MLDLLRLRELGLKRENSIMDNSLILLSISDFVNLY